MSLTKKQFGNWGVHKDGDLKAIREDSKWTTKNPFNFKYPLSVGEGFDNTYVNYNTHDSSDYAKARRDTNIVPKKDGLETGIHEEAVEPFVFFEFMEVASTKNMSVVPERSQKVHLSFTKDGLVRDPNDRFRNNEGVNVFDEGLNAIKDSTNTTTIDDLGVETISADVATEEHIDRIKSDKKWLSKVLRVYGGSIAMYMPTDIQVNDSITYNDDTRKTFGMIEGVWRGDIDYGSSAEANSMLPLTSAAGSVATKAIQAATKKFGLNFMKNIGGKVGAAIGVAGASVAQDEYQRSTGIARNQHEYLAYQATPMRTFTFNFTFLPDSLKESKETSKIIKSFRKAAHATRNDAFTITVPDHVVVSFHGAQDMIQLPPLVIETVNVTYNPNNTSFFKHGNAPVEVGLAITLKEMVPLYRQDVEEGW